MQQNTGVVFVMKKKMILSSSKKKLKKIVIEDYLERTSLNFIGEGFNSVNLKTIFEKLKTKNCLQILHLSYDKIPQNSWGDVDETFFIFIKNSEFLRTIHFQINENSFNSFIHFLNKLKLPAALQKISVNDLQELRAAFIEKFEELLKCYTIYVDLKSMYEEAEYFFKYFKYIDSPHNFTTTGNIQLTKNISNIGIMKKDIDHNLIQICTYFGFFSMTSWLWDKIYSPNLNLNEDETEKSINLFLVVFETLLDSAIYFQNDYNASLILNDADDSEYSNINLVQKFWFKKLSKFFQTNENKNLFIKKWLEKSKIFSQDKSNYLFRNFCANEIFNMLAFNKQYTFLIEFFELIKNTDLKISLRYSYEIESYIKNKMKQFLNTNNTKEMEKFLNFMQKIKFKHFEINENCYFVRDLVKYDNQDYYLKDIVSYVANISNYEIENFKNYFLTILVNLIKNKEYENCIKFLLFLAKNSNFNILLDRLYDDFILGKDGRENYYTNGKFFTEIFKTIVKHNNLLLSEIYYKEIFCNLLKHKQHHTFYNLYEFVLNNVKFNYLNVFLEKMFGAFESRYDFESIIKIFNITLKSNKDSEICLNYLQEKYLNISFLLDFVKPLFLNQFLIEDTELKIIYKIKFLEFLLSKENICKINCDQHIYKPNIETTHKINKEFYFNLPDDYQHKLQLIVNICLSKCIDASNFELAKFLLQSYVKKANAYANVFLKKAILANSLKITQLLLTRPEVIFTMFFLNEPSLSLDLCKDYGFFAEDVYKDEAKLHDENLKKFLFIIQKKYGNSECSTWEEKLFLKSSIDICSKGYPFNIKTKISSLIKNIAIVIKYMHTDFNVNLEINNIQSLRRLINQNFKNNINMSEGIKRSLHFAFRSEYRNLRNVHNVFPEYEWCHEVKAGYSKNLFVQLNKSQNIDAKVLTFK